MTSDFSTAARAEKERWKEDFPRSTKKIFFARGDENLFLSDIFLYQSSNWGPYIPLEFMLDKFSTAPAFPSHIPCKRTDGLPFHVIIGPDERGGNARDNGFVRAAQSDVPLEMWDRWVWDHETAHAMHAPQERPLYASRPHFSETVSDAYGLLRAYQHWGREAAEALTKDVLNLRRFMGPFDCLHYTEQGVSAARRWARHMGPRINRYTATGLLSVAETLAGKTSFTGARLYLLQRDLHRYAITKKTSLYEQALTLAEQISMPLSNPLIYRMRHQFVQAAKMAGRRLGLENEGLIPCVALVTRPPFSVDDLVLRVSQIVGYLHPNKRWDVISILDEKPYLKLVPDSLTLKNGRSLSAGMYLAYGADLSEEVWRQRAQEQLQQVSKDLDQAFYSGAAAKVKDVFQKTPEKLLSRGGRKDFVEDEILLWQRRQADDTMTRVKERQKMARCFYYT